MPVDLDNASHNAYGALIALTVSVLVILQLPIGAIDDAVAELPEDTRVAVAVYHFVCLLLVVVEATVESLQGKQPFFSQFVVCTGFVATVLEATLLADAEGRAFAYALVTFTVQSLANGFMFSKIVSEI